MGTYLEGDDRHLIVTSKKLRIRILRIGLALLIALIGILVLSPSRTLAAEDIALDISNGPIIIGAGSYTQNGQSHNHSGSYTISGTSETDGVIIQDGDHYITITGLTIDLSKGIDSKGAFIIIGGSSVSMLLENDNQLYSNGTFAGLQVSEGASLTISEDSTGTLLVRGGMNAETGSAGIGGAAGDSSGSITIAGGTITSIGGRFSAGIGGGDGVFGMELAPEIEAAPEDIVGLSGNGGEIVVTGGFITANGGYKGAGIGGGYAGNGGIIAITGGNVVSTSGSSGAGIGGGYAGNGGEISISGGIVDALSEFAGAGIGGGEYGSGGDIDISGGTITATSDTYGAGIGGGQNADSGNINITGGVIKATSHLYAAGIGGGAGGNAESVKIRGGTVSAGGGSFGAGIGGGRDGSGGDIVITGGSVSAKAGMEASDIGAGSNGEKEGSLTNGNQSVSLTIIQNAIFDDAITSLRSLEYPLYAYSGPGHGEADLFFYLPQGASSETERVYALIISDAIINGSLSISTEKNTQINGSYFAASGESIVLESEPDKGYRPDRYEAVILPQKIEFSVPSSGVFYMPDSDVQVSVIFKESFPLFIIAIIIIAVIGVALVILNIWRRKKATHQEGEI